MKISTLALIEACLQLIRMLTPPIIVQLAKGIVLQSRKRTKFFPGKSNVSEFKTYEDAMKHCSSKGYENKQLVQVIVDKTLATKAEIERKSVFELSQIRVVSAVGLAAKADRLNVIDFGGAAGHHFFVAAKALGERVKLNWRVVETPALAIEAERISNENLSFFDSIEEANKDLGIVDLVFSSGTLQCCPDPLKSLDEILKIRAKYLFITRTALLEQEGRVVRIQKSFLSTNGPGSLKSGVKDAPIYYPNVLVSKKDLEDRLLEDYEIKFSLTEGDGYSLGNKTVSMYGFFCVLRD
jgi:putative methyltransferase (TIGR04325 family)